VPLTARLPLNSPMPLIARAVVVIAGPSSWIARAVVDHLAYCWSSRSWLVVPPWLVCPPLRRRPWVRPFVADPVAGGFAAICGYWANGGGRIARHSHVRPSLAMGDAVLSPIVTTGARWHLLRFQNT
jgi:hypothetical protein